MASLLISYSRRDIVIARKLTEAFKGQNLDFWIDWEGIPPTVNWWKEIEKGIEEADIFLFLLSPDSVKSQVCKREIEHAIRNGKRLIPVVIRDVHADETPSELQPLNWIFLRESENFTNGFSTLMTAIKTDYEWAQSHRQIQVKALEWDRSSREDSFLLRGKELRDAENQLGANSSKEPYPTNLQREYVIASKTAMARQRRITTSVLAVAIIIIIWLAYAPAKSWLTTPEMPDWALIDFYQGDVPHIVTMNLENSNEVYASGQTKGSFYRSTNGGDTWQITTSPDINNEIIGLAAVDDKLYALTGQSIWLTQEKGDTWFPVKNPLADTQDKFLSISINPHNADEIFIGLNNGVIYNTKDGGENWGIVPAGYKGRLINAITTNGLVIVAATEEGIWYMIIEDSGWSEITLTGCSDQSDNINALSLTYLYSPHPDDGAFGFIAAVPGLGVCDSDTKNLYGNKLLIPQNTNITSIIVADQADLFAYEGYIAVDGKLLDKRIWRSSDIEWWKIKIESNFK